MRKAVVISVKPEFVNKILDGTKTIELRKSKPNINTDDVLLLYSTLPVKAIVGYCKVQKIIEASPEEIWIHYSDVLGIDRERFIEYYRDNHNAIAIVLQDIKKLKINIPLDSIKEVMPTFSPPQTFKYFNMEDFLGHYKSLASA